MQAQTGPSLSITLAQIAQWWKAHGPSPHWFHPTESSTFPNLIWFQNPLPSIISMASCRINSTLRCPSGETRFSSTCRPNNPCAPLLFINTTLSSWLPNLKRVIYSHSPKNCDSLKPLVVTRPNKTHASCCRRSRAPVLRAVALLLWGLKWPRRVNRSHRTECWSVRALHACSVWFLRKYVKKDKFGSAEWYLWKMLPNNVLASKISYYLFLENDATLFFFGFISISS